MTYNELLTIVQRKLGDNYTSTDSDILNNILEIIIKQASYISNREIDISNKTKRDENLLLLLSEIIDATIISYQERGTEYTKSQSELGQSNTFVDVYEFLRNNIIKNGKRVVF